MYNIIYDTANANKVVQISQEEISVLDSESFRIIQVSSMPAYDSLRQELYVQNGVVSVVNKSFTPSQLREIEAQEITNLRAQRESECFPIVNRGHLWYERLTLEQIAELKIWYQAWLDVTATKIVPTKPSWLV